MTQGEFNEKQNGPDGIPALSICVVGSGAIGSVIAGRLRSAGLAPLVVDGQPKHVARLRSPGLVLEADRPGMPIPLDAYTPDTAPHADRGGYDVVLLCVRANDTQEALAPVVPFLRGDVVSLQNGVNEEVIANLAGRDRTIGAVVGFTATQAESGRVAVTSSGGIVVGRLDGTRDERLEQVRDVLRRAVPCDITTNILGALWNKMITNSVTILGALGGMTTGEVLARGSRRRLVEEIVSETTAVARSEGVALHEVLGINADLVADRAPGWERALSEVLDVIAEHFAEVKSTVLLDFERQRKAEIDAVTGEIVRRGQRHDVPVPVTAEVYRMLREINAGNRHPELANIQILTDLASGN